MSFVEAIRTGFRKYVDFKGRARRSEFWYWFLFTVIVGIVASTLDSAFGLNRPISPDTPDITAQGPFESITSLILLLPTLAMSVRRLHDRSKSGWWVLLHLIPLIGSLILVFAFFIKDSEPGANRFGPNPKGVEGGYGAYDAGAYGQAPYGQAPYDQQGQQYGQAPYGQQYDQQGQQYGQAPYGQQGYDPQGQPSPYGQPGGEQPYDPQAPYGQQNYDPQGQQSPYGQPSGGHSFDPRNPYGQQAGDRPYDPQDPYGRPGQQNPYGQNPPTNRPPTDQQ